MANLMDFKYVIEHKYNNALKTAVRGNATQVVQYLIENREYVHPQRFYFYLKQAFISLCFSNLSCENTVIADLLLGRFTYMCELPYSVYQANCLKLFQHIVTNYRFRVSLQGFTQLCQEDGCLEFIQYILTNKKTKFDVNNDMLDDGFYWACRYNSWSVAKCLIKRRPKCIHRVYLWEIMCYNHTDVFDFLLANGYNIYQRNYHNFGLALSSENDYFIKCFLDKCNKTRKELIHLQIISNIEFGTNITTQYYYEIRKKRQDKIRTKVKRILNQTLQGILECPNECIVNIISYLV